MSQSFERLLLGRTLTGRYRVDAVEGRGGMSVVFRATDLMLRREVALKVVSLPAVDDAQGEKLRERFRREASAAASIPRHPNVVQVHDFGTDPELGLDFIVMELLRGRDLRQRLAAEGAPPLAEAVHLLVQAARGVGAGHAVGLVHRDVKPGNVFLMEEAGPDAVRVLDFGIAKPLGVEGEDDTLTVAGQLPHSPAYASPEQMDPDAALTPGSDVYQLGLVAYETLTGGRPYAPEERDRIRGGEPIPPAETPAWAALPAAVRQVVARALERDPASRQPDAGAFAAELAAALPGEEARAAPFAPPVEADDVTYLAPPPAPVQPSAATRRALPARAALAAVGAVLLVALLWAALSSRGGETAAAVPGDSVFLGLQGEVMGEASAAPAAGSDADRDAIRAAVHDLNKAWVDGDIRRHVSHYASRVDYYNSRRLPRAGVARDRTRDLRRYAPMRRIDVGDIEVEFTGPDEARAVATKAWEFRSESQTRAGSGQQEYRFRRDEDDGRWYVVGEQLLSRNEVSTGG